MANETADEMVSRVQMMASDSRGTWDLSENDQAALKHVLALLHDVASEADPAGTLRELRLAQDTIRALEKLIEELRVRAAIEFVHPLYLKCMRMRLEPEMECERDRKTVQWVLEAEIKTMYDRLKEERK